MIYESPNLHISFHPKEKVIVPKWTGAEMTAETFMAEMTGYMQLIKKVRPLHVVWNHTHFNFQIPDQLYSWIESSVNLPAKAMGMKKIGFILGENVLAQFSTMDCFEATNSVYVPRYFSDPGKALGWVTKKEDITQANPYESEMQLLIEKNLEKGTAKIQIEISLEQLPFYLKKVKDLFNHQAFVHKNYQKYMLLTVREKEILHYIVQGHSSQDIADRFFTSRHTVNTQRKNILRKLECRSLSELLKYKLFV